MTIVRLMIFCIKKALSFCYFLDYFLEMKYEDPNPKYIYI